MTAPQQRPTGASDLGAGPDPVLGSRPQGMSIRTVAGFTVLLVLFLTLVYLQLVEGDRLRARHDARAARLQQLRDDNRAALQYMTDAETGVRGFQLTGTRAYLEPYESGRSGAFAALDRIAAATDDATVRLLTAQREAATHWLYAYAIPIVNAGVADADEVRAARGKDLFDGFRTANADAEAAIVRAQESTNAADSRAAEWAELRFAGLALLILATGGAVAVAHHRHAVRREVDHARRQERLLSERRALDEQKDVFVCTVTHELRTPLTSIIGYAEMLADGDGGELSSAQRRSVTAIQRNADRLQATVADLSLLDSANEPIGADTEPVDLAELATSVHAELSSAVGAKDLRSRLEVEPGWVRGDGDRLRCALRNLLDNAIKFTPAGGQVSCRVSAAGERVQVTIIDTGIGIPAPDVAGLFTPFHRAANAMHLAVQGSGLGLAIVRRIATEHGGSVAARSEPGKGSSFTLTLPQAPPRSGPRSAEGP